jgi:hypothetical protein
MFKYLFLTLIIVFLSFSFSSDAHASTIFRAPSVDGLVGYWDFNDGAGTIAKDKSGQGNNGTLTLMDPATDWVAGKIGSNALDFDGSNDYVELGNVSALNFERTDSFSIGTWIKTTGVTSDQIIFSKQDNSGDVSNRGYVFHTDVSGTNARIGLDLVSTWSTNVIEVRSNTTTGTIISDNEWHYVVVTYDGSSSASGVNFYVDGTIEPMETVKDTLSATTQTSESVQISGREGSNIVFNGSIDDVRIYNRALSASEITNLYNSQKKSFPTVSKPTLSDGLVGYWNFDTGAGGSTVYDMSTSTNHGAMVNMDPATDWVDGKVGSGAMDFDGSNEYVNISDSTTWDFLGQNRTVSVWVNIDNYDSQGSGIVSRLSGSPINQSGWTLAVEIGTGKVEIFTGSTAGGAFVAKSTGGISLDTWYHLLFTKDSSENYQIYINGIADGSGTYSLVDNDLPLVFGDAYSSSSNNVWNLDGAVDEVRIYNRALSQEEITRLYKLTAGTKISSGLSKGLVGHWDFDDETGTLARDKSGNENHGTLTLMDPATDWVAGKIGIGALDFDGSNDYVNVSDTPSISVTKDLTISAWVNFDSITDRRAFVAKFDANPGLGSSYLFVNNAGKFEMFIASDPNDAGYNYSTSNSAILTTTGWHHVAGVYNSLAQTIILYHNGIVTPSTVTGTIPSSIPDTATPITIGKMVWRSGDYYFHDGKIDDVRIYNRALPAEEVTRLYNLGK